MTLEEMTARMSPSEFAAWQRYAEVEPFGSPRDDYRAGTVAALVANVNRDPKRRRDPYLAGDFFPEIAPPKPEPTFDELRAKLLAWGGGPKRRRRKN